MSLIINLCEILILHRGYDLSSNIMNSNKIKGGGRKDKFMDIKAVDSGPHTCKDVLISMILTGLTKSLGGILKIPNI